MSQSRAERVREAVRNIRRFHQLGRDLPARPPGGRSRRETYGLGLMKAEAESRGVNEDTARKARAFADRVEGYSRQEVNDLCRLLKTIQPGQDRGLAVFSPTHVIRLLSVRGKKRRAALQREAVEKGWSVSELEAAIAERFGTRRQGGRRRRIPAGGTPFLAQLELMCESWRRWQAEPSRDVGEGEAGRITLDDLDGLRDGLKKLVVRACRAVRDLHRAAAAGLQEARPGRAARAVFGVEPAESETRPRTSSRRARQ